MSPVTVGELNTEVVPDGAPGAEREQAQQQMPWHELERARRAQAELAELCARTSAEGLHA